MPVAHGCDGLNRPRARRAKGDLPLTETWNATRRSKFCTIFDMVFVGLGVDIVEVPRMARLIRRRKFLDKIFSSVELSYCRGRKNPAQHFAVRFAAKEAVYKALGRPGVSHRDISVRHGVNGQPLVLLRGSLRKLEKRVSISLSHTAQYAVAVAFLQP